MPCLEITMPKIESQKKAELARQLTDAFAQATKFGPEIFGIYFNEYDKSEAASGGVICDKTTDHPYLHMLIYCPRIDRETKQKLVESFTSVFTSVVGNKDWMPVIHICEHPYDNVGVNGKLLSDSYEECANTEFYYELPKK